MQTPSQRSSHYFRTMNRDVQTSPSKAPLSRRTKKTVPKPSMDLTPPPRQCRNADHEQIEKEKEAKHSGFQLASGLADVGNEELSADNLEVAYLNETEDEDDKMLLGSPQNYRRFSSRVRHVTDFYMPLSGDKSNDREASRGKGKRRASRTSTVVRKLMFEEYHTPLVAAPPDMPQTLVVKKRYRKSSEDKESQECEDDAVEPNSSKELSLEVDTTQPDSPSPPTSPATHSSSIATTADEGSSSIEEYPIGSMVWGRLQGYDWWPGMVISYCKDREGDTEGGEGEGGGMQVWIKWYGENNLSQIHIDRVAMFSNFTEYFNPHSLKGIYKKGIFMAIKEAGRRCKVEFTSRSDDKTPRWIITDGCSEPSLISRLKEEKEKEDEKGEGEGETEEGREDNSSKGKKVSSKSSGGKRRRKRAGRGERRNILLNSLEQEMLHWAQHGFQPAGPMGLLPPPEQSMGVQVVAMDGGGRRGEEGRQGKVGGGDGGEEGEPPKKKTKVMLLQVSRKGHFESVTEGKMKISDLCIACGDMAVVAEHPLFHGALCKECKGIFLECTYLFDDDGTQMYCCICSAGEEVFMCDAQNCAKVYCAPCIEKLCGPSEVERVKAADQWLCYMCCPEFHSVGLLTRRGDWDVKLQELFLNDNEMEYESTPFSPISPEQRKPIRVLGLFDGIGTGLLVLKELGIEIGKYVASEIDPDAIKVSRVWHKEMVHIGNISKITEKEIKEHGPFDLVLGGSPCNDLSIVNPARKGIYEGTGRLFFEFFRILCYVRLAGNGDRPLFWLYENVVSMRAQDKQIISRFLQCNPVVVDAKDISASHRARYFWGNIPGMNRAVTPLPGDRLTLQDCLEPNCSRYAQFNKLRTITTKMNSIKQTKRAIYPVRTAPLVDGIERPNLSEDQMQGDVLWCTEMERLFGFPDHYTDVGNLGRSGRQKLLGKAWNVPVLRHILSPLKDYFQSDTTRDRKTPPTS